MRYTLTVRTPCEMSVAPRRKAAARTLNAPQISPAWTRNLRPRSAARLWPRLRQPGLAFGQLLATRVQLPGRAPAQRALEVQVHLRFGHARQTRFQVRLVQPAATRVDTAHTA